MSETENEIITALSKKEEKLDAEDRAYILGVIDGMVAKAKSQKGEEE